MDGSANSGFDELKQLVDSAFPDLRCLRCGNDPFLLASDVDALGTGKPNTLGVFGLQSSMAGRGHPVPTRPCTRCGHIEHHVVGLLAAAPKPIAKQVGDG